jgi:ankyrin repeat protein
MEGEELDVGERLKITVEFLSYKSIDVLREFADVIPKNLIDSQGLTLLHHAVLNGQSSKVAFLIEAGLVEAEIKDNSGRSALEIALRKKHLKIIKFLAGLGLTCTVRSQLALNPAVDLDVEGRIVNCIYADNVEELKNNMSYVTNINGFFSSHEVYEWTLMGVAAYHLSYKSLEYFLRLGCSSDVCEGDGLSFVDNALNAVIQVLPPENEEEYIAYNSGIETLLVLINNLKNLNTYKVRLWNIFNKSKLVGKNSSSAQNSYEDSVITKNLVFGLTLGRYLDSFC